MPLTLPAPLLRRGVRSQPPQAALREQAAFFDAPAVTIPVLQSGGGNYRSLILADQPTSYWRLDDAAVGALTDQQNNRPGSYVGTVSLGQPGVTGDGDTSVYFDGSSARGAIPGNLADPIFSLELWCKSLPSGSSGTQRPFCSGSYGGNQGFVIDYSNVTAISTVIYNTSGTYTAGGSIPASRGVWHHVVMTYDGTNVRVYTDGALKNTYASTYAPYVSGSQAIGIAARGDGAWLFFGYVDEVAYYNYVLTDAQIRGHYLAASIFGPSAAAQTQALAIVEAGTLPPRSVSTGTLLAWYKADALAGYTNSVPVTSWPDDSGNGYTAVQATIANTPNFYVNQVNGLPALMFNGTSDQLQATIASTNIPVTMFVVLNTNVANGVGGSVFGIAGFLRCAVGGLPSSTFQPRMFNGNSQPNGIADPENVYNVFTYQHNGASSLTRQNGIQTAAADAGSDAGGATLFIGQAGDNGARFPGYVAEMIVYTGALSAADMTTVENYLIAKYFVMQTARPDADVVTTGWTTTPLWSQINDSSDTTYIQATET